MIVTDNLHVLYTRGSVPYYGTYPGPYIPRPIEIRLAKYDESPNIICDEILSLTKIIGTIHNLIGDIPLLLNALEMLVKYQSISVHPI